MTRPAALVIASLLAGCSTVGIARRDFLNTLVGQPEAELFRRLGPPAGIEVVGSHRYVTYLQLRATALAFGSPAAYPSAIIGHVCETTLDVVGGRVADWSLRGDGCAR